MNEPLQPIPDPMATELVQAIRRSDAILYVVARRSTDPGHVGELVVDWGADGMPKRYAALLMRDVATEWDRQADDDGEPPVDANVTIVGCNPTVLDTTSEINE